MIGTNDDDKLQRGDGNGSATNTATARPHATATHEHGNVRTSSGDERTSRNERNECLAMHDSTRTNGEKEEAGHVAAERATRTPMELVSDHTIHTYIGTTTRRDGATYPDPG